MKNNPHWEHGYRTHGYWLGNTRVGAVGLSPPGFPLEYAAYLDKDYNQVWYYKSLKAAKRRVEKEYQALG